MRAIRESFDVVVLGAGTAGAAAAAFLSEAGLRAALLDTRPLDQAGACWVNAVPYWFYDAAGLDRPVSPEDVAPPDGALRMLPVSGGKGFEIRPAPAPTVDMALLVRRLHRRAVASGVHCFAPVRDLVAELVGPRPVAVTGIHEPGDAAPRRFRLEARLFVDATGWTGFLRGLVPTLRRDCPVPTGRDLCAALQEDCELADPEGAQAFLAARDMRPGDVAGWVGVRGGFSTRMVHVHGDLAHAGLLIGASGDGRNGTAAALMARLKADHPFVGRGIRGGGGMIPVRRPFDRLVAPGVALVGDAACQVFPGHASGVGMGLVAARMLADAIASGDDPGAIEALWGYAARFQRTHGPILGAFDVFRRMAWDMPESDVQALTDCGFVGPGMTQVALSQRLGPVPLGELISIARGALRRPDLAARMALIGPRMAAVAAAYKAYPADPDPGLLARWSRALGTAAGVTPDVREGDA